MRNPFYWLEIRIRASEKRLWIIALFFLLSVALIGGGFLLLAVFSGYQTVVPGELGQNIIYTLIFWQGVVLIVLAPLASAGRISQEREQRTLPALLNTSVSPMKIVWGKLLAAWMFIFWLAAFVFPFLGIGYFWGGMPPLRLLALAFVNVIISAVIASLALGFSGLLRRSLTSYLVTGAFMLGWIVVIPIMGGISLEIIHALDIEIEGLFSYLFFYHNPFFPSILIVGDGMDFTAAEAAARLAYCFAVWIVLAGCGLMLARRGLRKEVY